ncbi:MBL fold metallo-hydrolase [Methylophilus sp.]|jgi:sulfur dioxygenase|uniref:MBL fold metallo-hydrolase n=1 Tax=Methylophilus sp. TaxID=29541 RepID=UPI0011D929C6|nr:MBL fold metallo-hydrolase [Methylophilus sp.]TXI45911.1 MAG: MBL fold metallo-hydrolase [Methylophilus sp.]
MIFEQFFEPDSSTYTYLLGCEDSRQAVLIDPVAVDVARYIDALAGHGLTLIYTLETHVHADHVTAADALRQRLGSKSVVHRDAGALCGDLLVTEGTRLQVGALEIDVRYTPGHTNGCVSYLVGDRIFTGDALLINGCGRTDFQQGDAGQLYDSIHHKIFTLPDATLVYPGHDYHGRTVSTVGHEKQSNARLGGHITRAAFIELMANLKLAYPKQIDVALPANQACGKQADRIKQSS